jgi:PmbA protein
MKGLSLEAAARRIVEISAELGAEETTARVSKGSWTELTRRDGKVEKAQESRSLSAGVSLMVDGRYSSHSTSDLRPESLRAFLERAVAATRFLEPDPDRRLPELEKMGDADVDLDPLDPGQAGRSPDDRRADVEALEARAKAHTDDLKTRSITAFGWDGASESALVTSHGFSSSWASTSFGLGASVSLEDEGGKLPEAWTSYQARHHGDVPAPDAIARDLAERGRSRLGSGPMESGRYPLLLDRRVVSGLLRVLMGPLAGTAIFEGRSCLKDKLGEKIGSSAFTLIDDPLIPRGLGSRPHDGDGLPARRRTIVDEGVLKMFFISVYNSRRLGMPGTTGGASNLVIPAGDRSPTALAADRGRVIRVDGFLGGNSNASTGDFSFGIQGALLEDGAPVRALSEMNVSGDLFGLLERFVAAADDPWTHGSWRTPTLLFDDVQFSGA